MFSKLDDRQPTWGKPPRVKLDPDVKRKLEDEAMAFAELIYDMYKEDLETGRIINGQNYADQSKNEQLY